MRKVSFTASALLAGSVLMGATPIPAPTPHAWPTPLRAKANPASPAASTGSYDQMTQKQMDALLQKIRLVFRSHRPLPQYETYRIERFQTDTQGFTDEAGTYKDDIWVRTADDAALRRRLNPRGGGHQQMQFIHPLFNTDDDPGPPTADIFQPAPLRRGAGAAAPTPMPSGTLPPQIASVKQVAETQYKVTAVRVEGNMLHLSVVPFYDVDRNRLREIYVDKNTLELKRMVATDKLFIEGTDLVYPVMFYALFDMLNGVPVVTTIHGEVGGGYEGDGQTVEYHFTNIQFPSELPSWYFDPRQYAQHIAEAPE